MAGIPDTSPLESSPKAHDSVIKRHEDGQGDRAPEGSDGMKSQEIEQEF